MFMLFVLSLILNCEPNLVPVKMILTSYFSGIIFLVDVFIDFLKSIPCRLYMAVLRCVQFYEINDLYSYHCFVLLLVLLL